MMTTPTLTPEQTRAAVDILDDVVTPWRYAKEFGYNYYCPYCEGGLIEHDHVVYEHDDDCPIARAQALLAALDKDGE